MELDEFTAAQRSVFLDALMAAYPTYPSLNMMLRLGLNIRLAAVSAPAPMNEVALALIDWAEEQGRLEELIGAALQQNPRNPKLKAFSYEVLLNVPTATRLEAIVRPHVPMQDPARWRSDMERLERGVCRIEMPRDEAAGSGFLIADDLVLTNCHVARQLALRRASPADCVARFGFRAGAGGSIEQGDAVPFAGQWEVESSPVEALDYAVVRLASAPGRPNIPRPSTFSFRADDIYFILQHPSGSEIKMSAGVYESYDPAASRVRYTANTEAGSSGSPVFSIGWQPIALHHAGDSRRNSGVVLTAVAASGNLPALWQ